MVSSRTADGVITGSWHNSGYYGHFRSRIRNDFMNEYRQRAKPAPPQRYIERSKAPARKHIFSKHDSRERYKNNALYFVDGNGRRQVHGPSTHYKPDFIAWMPHKKEIIDNRQPLTSVYKSNYHRGVKGYGIDPYQQMYSTKIASQASIIGQPFDCHDEKAAYTDGYKTDPVQHFQTTYRRVHCTRDPRTEEAKYINTLSTRSANDQKINRARSARPMLRESVASCLSWSSLRPHTTVPDTHGSVSQIDKQTTSRSNTEPTSLVKAEPSFTQLPTVSSSATAIKLDPSPVIVC